MVLKWTCRSHTVSRSHSNMRPSESERRAMYDLATQFVNVQIRSGVNATAHMADFKECPYHDFATHLVCPVYGIVKLSVDQHLTSALDDCVKGAELKWEMDSMGKSGRWVINVPFLQQQQHQQKDRNGSMGKRRSHGSNDASCANSMMMLLMATVLALGLYVYYYVYLIN